MNYSNYFVCVPKLFYREELGVEITMTLNFIPPQLFYNEVVS